MTFAGQTTEVIIADGDLGNNADHVGNAGSKPSNQAPPPLKLKSTPSYEALLRARDRARRAPGLPFSHLDLDFIDFGPIEQQPLQAEVGLALECLKPRDDSYDEETTVRRHIALLPTEGMLRDAKWRFNFPLDPPPGNLVKICPPSWPATEEGLLPVVKWSVGDLLSREVVEYGYDENGYPVLLPTLWSRREATRWHDKVFEEHTFIGSKPGESSPPWDWQRFGKEWVFFLRRKSDPSNLSVAICQLLGSEEHGFSIQLAASRFLLLFRSKWVPIDERAPIKRHTDSGWYLPPEADHRSLVFQHHLRLLSTSRVFPSQMQNFRLIRKFGSIHEAGGRGGGLFVRESRISLAVRTTYDLDLPVFSMVVVSDCEGAEEGGTIHQVSPLAYLSHLDLWHRLGIQPSIRSTAISAFAFRLYILYIMVWRTEWTRTLDEFESHLKAEIDDILSPRKRRKLMYDNSDLAVSELYFLISQMLRFAADWIRESVDDLRVLKRYLERFYRSPYGEESTEPPSFLPDSPDARQAAMEVFNHNWDALLSGQQKLADELLARIARMQEEVKRLREGLFTATAVLEATKSKQLNHYILVFTVVTIFYLPLSFVAALYALDLFNWDDPNQTVSFAVTLVLVAGTTYGFAGFLIWSVGDRKRRRVWKKTKRVKAFMKHFTTLGKRVESDEEESD